MANSKEKRKNPRIETSIPMRYKELRGKSYLAKGTHTKNVSKGGARFVTDRFISLACHLVVEMNLPAPFKSVKAISKIAWIKKLPTDDRYEVGNQFLAMTSEDETMLTGYTKEADSKKI